MQFSFDNKLQKHAAILSDASKFYANILLPKNISKKVWVDFEVDSSIPYEAQVVFDCPYGEDDTAEAYNEGWLPFTLSFQRFSKNSIESHLKTLAHEMVHIKQYATGELSKELYATRRGFKMKSFWNGIEYKKKPKEDEYWDLPWEVEAYGREEGLYRRYRNI